MTPAPAWLRRLWPRRLAGQMIALLLLALVLAQAVSFLIFADERWSALRTSERKHILARTASIVRLIESTPPALHEQIARTASSRQLRFWLSEQSVVTAEEADGDSWLRRRLVGMLDDGLTREVLIRLQDGDDHFWSRGGDRDEEAAREATLGAIARADEVDGEHRGRWRHHGPPADLLISTRLNDGRWLNSGLAVPDPPPRWTLPTLLAHVADRPRRSGSASRWRPRRVRTAR
jgi:hypothetical protein